MLVFILFIFAKIWPAVLLGLFLSSLAWWLGWSKGISLYALSLPLLLGLAILFPIVWAGLYLLLLAGLMTLINRCLPQSAWKGWLLVFLGMGILIVPYLAIFAGVSSYSYGYGHFNHQGERFTVVYQREDYEFFHFTHHLTLTEYLYPERSLLPIGQRDSHLALEFGEENPGLPFILPTSEMEKVAYLNGFE